MNRTIASVIVAIVIAGGSFYAGMKYGSGKNILANAGSGFANLSPQERQARAQQGGMMGFGGGGQRGAGMRGGGGFVSGEILSKDDKSITLKLGNARAPAAQNGGSDGQGGSKIIFFSDSTQIMKSAPGSVNDLTVGDEVIATGNTNSDGSISAQSIQVRPQLPTNQNK